MNEYLHEVDVEAAEQVRTITGQIAKSRDIGEKPKADDMLRWVAEMNNCKAADGVKGLRARCRPLR